MPLPETIRVKLSSEAAESIALTPVVVQEMAVRELIEHVLGVTGKDEARIRDLLIRGTLVSGASRFRWAGWEAEAEGLAKLLATFPDPDPNRVFAPASCVRAILRGGRQTIDITREAGARRGMFQRRSFWDDLMAVAGEAPPEYVGYSYRDRADRYQRDFTHAETERLRGVCRGLRYSTLRDQVQSVAFTHAELLVKRT
jgi:hypothetical protein